MLFFYRCPTNTYISAMLGGHTSNPHLGVYCKDINNLISELRASGFEKIERYGDHVSAERILFNYWIRRL